MQLCKRQRQRWYVNGVWFLWFYWTLRRPTDQRMEKQGENQAGQLNCCFWVCWLGACWSIRHCLESAAPCTLIAGWRILVAVLPLRFFHFRAKLSASHCYGRPGWFTLMSRCFNVVFLTYSVFFPPNYAQMGCFPPVEAWSKLLVPWGIIQKQPRQLRAAKSINNLITCFEFSMCNVYIIDYNTCNLYKIVQTCSIILQI